MKAKEQSISSLAAQFWGWAGTVPFLGLTIAGCFTEELYGFDVTNALITYGAIILSFLGGIQWGLTMATANGQPNIASRYANSIVPALLSAFAFALPANSALVLLAAGFLTLLLYEIRFVERHRVPIWHLRLRVLLTATVLSCLFFRLFSTNIQT